MKEVSICVKRDSKVFKCSIISIICALNSLFSNFNASSFVSVSGEIISTAFILVFGFSSLCVEVLLTTSFLLLFPLYYLTSDLFTI